MSLLPSPWTLCRGLRQRCRRGTPFCATRASGAGCHDTTGAGPRSRSRVRPDVSDPLPRAYLARFSGLRGYEAEPRRSIFYQPQDLGSAQAQDIRSPTKVFPVPQTRPSASSPNPCVKPVSACKRTQHARCRSTPGAVTFFCIDGAVRKLVTWTLERTIGRRAVSAVLRVGASIERGVSCEESRR